ncbi:MAG: T9SS type A sorting domain-containing protein, partial [Bacteroidia bacterium]
FAHVYTNTIITETEWKTITGSFIADEAYSYLYIGNPFDDANTDTVSYDSSNPPGSYYLIDDVYVSETPLSTHENSLQANVTVYPTIVEHQFFIALNELHNKECSISIYNALGMEIQTIKNPNESIITVNATNYAKGMYFVKIEANKKVITKKIIVK